MNRSLSIAVLLAFISKSAQAEMLTERPITREDECLAVFEEVYFGFEWISVSDFLTKYWNDRLASIEDTYSERSKEAERTKALAMLNEAGDAENAYLIFRKLQSDKKGIYLEFNADDGYIGKLVEMSGLSGDERVTYSREGEYYSSSVIVKLGWHKDEFTYKYSSIYFSDGEPSFVHAGPKWKGLLECPE